jgi:putative SOS response-associated peptidase YedK
MCNDYEQHVTHADYVRAVAAAELDAARPSASDLPTADDIKIGDLGPVLVAVGNGVGLRPMRFGWAPPRKGASRLQLQIRRPAFREVEALRRHPLRLLRIHRHKVPKNKTSF